MHNVKLPNLELIVYMAKQQLGLGSTSSDNFTVETFLQAWPNNCVGHDVDVLGNTKCALDILTHAYTTVVYCKIAKKFVVFFDNEFAYTVDACPKFIDDLKNKNLPSVSKSNY